MKLTINYSQGEMLKDADSDVLPMQALTDQRNARPYDGDIRRIGYDRTAIVDTNIVGTHISHHRVDTDHLWALAADTNVYAFRFSDIFDITRISGPYSAGGAWNSCSLNGIPVFSNGIDPPQVWTPPALNRNLIDLPNWPVTQTALVMRAHYAVLIALGMMIDGAYYRRTLKWSHPADPGAVPISWDEADPNMDVGMTDIADTDDNIVDGLSMKSRFYIYKEYNTWMLEPLGSTSIRSLFKLSRVFTGLGILAANCVADVLGKHFVVGTEDILAHDGSQIQWVADKKVKKWFYRNLNMNDFAKTYVVHFPPFKEVWIPFPDAGSGGSINMALVWQYTDGKFYVRDLNHNPRSMYYGGYLGDAGDQWNQAVGDWSTDAQPWELSVNPVVDQSMLSACDDSIDIHDERNWSAQSFPATQIIERTDWPFGDIGKDGQAFPAYDRVKMYRTIWPRFIAPTGTLFTFEFGWRDDLTDDIQWDLPKTFTCGPGEKIDLWQRGRYLSYRISSATTTPWRFTGMNVEFDLLGIR